MMGNPPKKVFFQILDHLVVLINEWCSESMRKKYITQWRIQERDPHQKKKKKKSEIVDIHE